MDMRSADLSSERQDTSGSKGKTNYTKNGVSGCCQLGESGKESKRVVENPTGWGKILHGLISRPWNAEDRIQKIQ
jgi:hypothetical protein